jgi:hypothetical protein
MRLFAFVITPLIRMSTGLRTEPHHKKNQPAGLLAEHPADDTLVNYHPHSTSCGGMDAAAFMKGSEIAWYEVETY